MIDPGKLVTESVEPPCGGVRGVRLFGAIVFGIAFGFLLQKGGVGKYNVLVGQLLLQDFTVLKVMLSAILVGMAGVFVLHHFAKANLHIIPTRIAPQGIGGLLFGAGFALIAYCPGTGAAALGQGSWDVLFGMAGLVAGSYLFAEMSGWLDESIGKWGDKGKVLLSDLVPISRSVFVSGFIILLLAVLFSLDRLTDR